MSPSRPLRILRVLCVEAFSFSSRRRAGGLSDVQDRLAGEVAVDQAAGESADLVPFRLDRDLRLQLAGGDQFGEQRQADAAALDAHQLVEQGEAVKAGAAGAE